MPERFFPNQNHITFQSVPKNKRNSYGVYNKEALFRALKDLNLYAFKLYLYLGSFQGMQDGLYLSKQDVLKTTSMNEKSYFIAKKELKEKGYLIPDTLSSSKHAYIFYELPPNRE